MDWLEWLRLAAEVIALVISWFAGRNQLRRAAISRALSSPAARHSPVIVTDFLAIVFPPARNKRPTPRGGTFK